jgi:hypothetical protein
MCSTTVRATAQDLEELGRTPHLQHISFNGPILLCLDTVLKQYDLPSICAEEPLLVPHATPRDTQANPTISFPAACVVDSGVQTSHPHFRDNALVVVPGERLDHLKYHATHLCSIITGAGTLERGNTKIEVQGVAGPVRAQVIPLQMYSNDPNALLDMACAKIMESLARDSTYPYQVLNLSWSLSGPEQNPAALNEVLNKVAASGKVIVVAGGNPPLGQPKGSIECFRPAGHDKVITVGCKHYNYNYMPTLYAPGNFNGAKADDNDHEGLGLSTCGKYIRYEGSSQAAAFVTGVCLLLLSKCPTFPPSKLKDLLVDSCDAETRVINPRRAWGNMQYPHYK